MTHTSETRTTFPLTAITKLCDAAMLAFGVLHQEEIDRRKLAKARLAIELTELDLFAPALHYSDAEDYVPGGGA